MTTTLPPRKRRLFLLYLPISTYRTRNLLWVLPILRNLKYRCYSLLPNNSNSLCGVCSTMRTNKLLRSNSNHQPSIRDPLHRKNIGRMNLRRVRRSERYTKPILRLSLSSPICYCRTISTSPFISSPDRLQQPPWHQLQLR